MTLLRNGNSKLGKNIYSFSLPISTCKHKTDYCRQYCYAKKGNFAFPTVKKHYASNLRYTRYKSFRDHIVLELMVNRAKYVRIHPSGDFYSQKYFDQWVSIANTSPSVQFLAYTRNYDLDTSKAPSNFHIYFSIDSSTCFINTTIDHYALVAPQKGSHMELKGSFRICDSKCFKCKACWSSKINVLFPMRGCNIE